MRSLKWLLIAGLVFIMAGVFVRLSGVETAISLVLFAVGGGSKLSYFLLIIRLRKYKPGFEFFYLIAGLLLLFWGIQLRDIDAQHICMTFLLVSGVLLKFVFLFHFFRKLKMHGLKG